MSVGLKPSMVINTDSLVAPLEEIKLLYGWGQRRQDGVMWTWKTRWDYVGYGRSGIGKTSWDREDKMGLSGIGKIWDREDLG